jgi:diacylglycerol kinase
MSSYDAQDWTRPGLRHTPTERMAFRLIGWAAAVAVSLLMWWGIGCAARWW